MSVIIYVIIIYRHYNPVPAYSQVLSCVQSNLLIEAEDDVIKNYEVEFLDTNSAKVAKTLLGQQCPGHEDCPIRKGNNTLVSHFNDIITTLKYLEKTNTDVPNFVIKCPMEVSCHCLHLPISKFNELHQVLLGMSSKLDNFELSFPQFPKPASVLDSHATVIVSKVLDALSDHLK